MSVDDQSRIVEGFMGRYKATPLGSIIDSWTGRELPHIIDRDGYHLVRLLDGNHYVYRRVHRLVAEAFIPNENGKPTVNHIDENKDNNAVYNLEWATYREQVNHGSRNRRAMETIDSCRVSCISEDGSVIETFESIRDAARAMSVKPERILSVLKGRQKKAAGHMWKYEDYPVRQKRVGTNAAIGIVQKTLDGEIVMRYRSIRSAAKTLNISPAGIWECLHGMRKSNVGFLWEYDKEPIEGYLCESIPVKQLDTLGNLVRVYTSVADAARSVGSSTGSICRCLKGRRETCGGFKWEYA